MNLRPDLSQRPEDAGVEGRPEASLSEFPYDELNGKTWPELCVSVNEKWLEAEPNEPRM